MKSIPIVDIGTSSAAATLGDALERIGFAYIVGHGLPDSLRDAAFAASRAFHASTPAQKQSLAINAFHRGYMGIATSTIVTSSVAKVTRPNLSDSLMVMHPLAADDPDLLAGKPLQGPNQWPDWLPGFRPTIEAYQHAAEAVSRRIVQLIAVALDLPETALDRYFDKPTTFLRLLHYPPQPIDETGIGSAPHTDYGIITLLAQDDSGGLEVKPRGQDWIGAPPIPGSFVLNVGDMLARWTNDRFVSTPHRVINRATHDRYSLPFFFDTGMDAIIECLPSCTDARNPPRYPPIRYGDYLMDRLNRNYAYRHGDDAGPSTKATGASAKAGVQQAAS